MAQVEVLHLIKWSGNCLNVIGFHPTVGSIVHLGVDHPVKSSTTATDPAPQLTLHEPISGIQFTDKILLISTLSGYVFFSDVFTVPPVDPSTGSYSTHLEWANSRTSMRLKCMFRFQDCEEENDGTGPETKGMLGQWSLCAKSDEWRMMSGGSQGYLAVWNHRIGKFLYKLKTLEERPGVTSTNTLATSEVGSMAAFAKKSKGGKVRALTGLAFDDSYIVAGGMDGKVHVWEPSI